MNRHRPSKLTNILVCTLIFVSSFITSARAGNPRTEAQPGAHTESLRVVASTESEIEFELQAPQPAVKQIEAGGRPCQVVEIKDFAENSDSGKPRLPVRGEWIGVPATGQPQLEVLAAESINLPGNYSICPVAAPIIDTLTDQIEGAGPAMLGYQVNWDDPVYIQNQFFPAVPAELAEIGFVRNQRMALVRFQPVQYNPVTGELRYFARLRVRVTFPPTQSLTKDIAANDEGPFEAIFEDIILNHKQARSWRAQPALPPAPDSILDVGLPRIKLLVNQDGLYRVTYAQLQAAGAPVGLMDPFNFSLTCQGDSVARSLEDNGDHVFDPGETLTFYGRKSTTYWTASNIYWLSWDNNNEAISIATRPSDLTGFTLPIQTTFIQKQRIERNSVFANNYATSQEQDHWFWQTLNIASPMNFTYTFEATSVSPSATSLNLRALFIGATDTPDHHTRIFLNNQLIGDEYWPGTGEYEFSMVAPHSLLRSGTNEIRVAAHVDVEPTSELFLLDHFELDYLRLTEAQNDKLFLYTQPGDWEVQIGNFNNAGIRVFDVTTPNEPVEISDLEILPQAGKYLVRYLSSNPGEHRYFALSTDQILAPQQVIFDENSSLHSAENKADYLVITHENFYEALQPLVAYRQSQGLDVRVIKVQNIYDEFSYGLPDPEAIRAFIAYTYAVWMKPEPSFVLFVGDGNFDPLNYKGFNDTNFVPPYLADVDLAMRFTAADNRYVSVSGNDALPDMALGRLPVHTAAEAAAAIAKIIGYESATVPAPDNWNRKLMFVADDFDPETGNFPVISHNIIENQVTPPYTVDEIYYKVNYNDTPAITQAISTGINQGRFMVSYIGHGGVQHWANELLFSRSNLSQLTNGGRLPVMLSMTCLDGYYIWPNPPTGNYNSFGESFVNLPTTGAIASFSPTGMGVATGHDLLERGFFDAVFNDYITQIGPATVAAKLHMYEASGGGYTDLLETYTLFGDPATQLPVARPNVQITKTPVAAAVDPSMLTDGIRLAFDITLTNNGDGPATHLVLSDPLPAWAIPGSATFTSSGDATFTLRSSPTFAWDVSDLAPGASATLTLAIDARPEAENLFAPGGALFANTAFVVSAGELAATASDNSTTVMAGLPYVYRLPLFYVSHPDPDGPFAAPPAP